jgi:hypothetical protein
MSRGHSAALSTLYRGRTCSSGVSTISAAREVAPGPTSSSTATNSALSERPKDRAFCDWGARKEKKNEEKQKKRQESISHMYHEKYEYRKKEKPGKEEEEVTNKKEEKKYNK